MHAVEFKPRAEKDFDGLPKQDQKRVAALIDRISANPWFPGTTKLVGGDGLRRARSGNYRMIYAEPDEAGIILVLKIGHRKDVHDRL